MPEYIAVYNLRSVLESGREIREFEVSLFYSDSNGEAIRKANGEYMELTSKNHGGLNKLELALLFEAKIIQTGTFAEEVLEKLKP